jgi:siderophore ferric iron reductase
MDALASGIGAARRAVSESAPPDPDLARVLAMACRAVPGLSGEQDAAMLPAALRLGTVAGSEALRALTRHWADGYPEAGAHYLALRCWGLAIWQPVYLLVLAAHLDTHVPRLAGLAQPVAGGFPRGFRLPPHAPMRGDLPARMAHAAAELRIFCGQMRAALAPHVALHARAANALQAECVLGALLAARRHAPERFPAALEELGQDWLARLGIPGGCGMFVYRARDGTPVPALDRQVCCHYFRRRDGEKCSTCPKLPIATRIALLQAEAP